MFTFDSANLSYQIVLNGNVATPTTGLLISPFSGTISVLNINRRENSNGNMPLDELRLYPRILKADEIVQNYNGGLGNNPSRTEGMLLWYKFENFETLDFSQMQNDSLLSLGIRDLSGQNNHGLITGVMDTNSSSSTYALTVV